MGQITELRIVLDWMNDLPAQDFQRAKVLQLLPRFFVKATQVPIRSHTLAARFRAHISRYE
jgi:hypothetical protein